MMQHLNENEMIDLLFDESDDPVKREHLNKCQVCREQFQILEEGLTVARLADPGEIPLERVVPARKWKRNWLTVAAIVFLCFSLAGFRAEFKGGDFSIQFAMFPFQSSAKVQQEQLEALEAKLVDALNLQADITATQINQQFSDFQNAQYKDLVELSIQVRESMASSDIQTDRRLAMLNQNMESLQNKRPGSIPSGGIQ